MIVLDSGGVTGLAERSSRAAALISVLRRDGLWPPLVPSAVLIECLHGRPDLDAAVNRFLRTVEIDTALPEARARRAARLRTLARRGSAVDALVVATAEPGGTVYGSDVGDLRALAGHARGVAVEPA